MALETRHITRIESTFAFFVSDCDHGQSAITTDNDDWCYKNENGSKVYTVARQHYFDGSYHHCDNEFGEVALFGDLLINSHIKFRADLTNYIHMQLSSISFAIASTDQLTIGTTSVKINSNLFLYSGGSVNEISNDDTMADGSSSALCTEYAIKNYFSDNSYWDRNSGSNTIFPNTITDLVGIGNINPEDSNIIGNWLVIGNFTQVNNGLTIRANPTGTSNILFADGYIGAQTYRGIIQYNHDTDNMEIHTAAALRMVIGSSGNVVVNDGIYFGCTTDTDLCQFNTTNFRVNNTLRVAGGNLVIDQGANIYIDNGSDTFIKSPSSDVITFTTGAIETFKITIDDIIIPYKLYIGANTPDPDVKFLVEYDCEAVTSSTSLNLTNTHLKSTTCPISSGKTDSGERVGLKIDQAIDDSGFLGNLDNQYGFQIFYGSSSGSGSGILDVATGIELNYGNIGSATINEAWGIKQNGAGTKNYFEGQVRVGGFGTPTTPFEIDGFPSSELVEFVDADWDRTIGTYDEIGILWIRVNGYSRGIVLTDNHG